MSAGKLSDLAERVLLLHYILEKGIPPWNAEDDNHLQIKPTESGNIYTIKGAEGKGMPVRRVGVSELRKMNTNYLRNLTEPLEVCFKNQPLGELVPYELFLAWQDVIGAEAALFTSVSRSGLRSEAAFRKSAPAKSRVRATKVKLAAEAALGEKGSK